MAEEVPKDLGIKVVDKKDKFWHDLRERISNDIETNEHNIEINKVILDYIEKKLKP